MTPSLFDPGAEHLSFEVFPPKKDEEFENVYKVLDALSTLQPAFISCTYGAGGSRSKSTAEIVSYIKNRLDIEAIAHLTCVGGKKEELLQIAQDLQDRGISYLLALRGDRPSWMDDAQYEGRDFAHASDMLRFLKSNTSFHFAGACYPEKHYEAGSLEADLRHLKEKVEAGAEFLISQLFFENDCFYRFLDKAEAAGIRVPVCAGIMPITTAKQLGTTVSLSGSSVPKKLADLIAVYGDNPEDMRKAGIEYAAGQILDLRRHGVNKIHIYSMNKVKTTAQIVEAIR